MEMKEKAKEEEEQGEKEEEVCSEENTLFQGWHKKGGSKWHSE